MFEITFSDRNKFENLIKNKKAYPKGKYDFTLEKRFIVYHCPLRQRLVYIAIDMKTGYGSEVIALKNKNQLTVRDFNKLIPLVLYSIKYTGDKRYLIENTQDGYTIIEYIFKVVLPEYGYTIRNEQIKLCKSMYDGFMKKSVAICEAEVGTGKTLAFLIAALVTRITREEMRYRSFNPITIATSNIELQRSLIEKDIPKLSNMLKAFNIINDGIESVLRKGREHYFCKRRFEDFMASIEAHPRKHKELIDEMKEFERHSPFDLDRYEMRTYLKSKMCVRGCNGKCKYKEMCRYRRYIEKSKKDELDIQITNHNQYLMDLKMRKEEQSILRKSDFVVIDEAHKLRDAAQDVFGTQLLEKEISEYLDEVKKKYKKGCKEPYGLLMKSICNYESKLIKVLKTRISDFGEEDVRDNIIELNPEELRLIGILIIKLGELEFYQEKDADSAKYIIDKLKTFAEQGRHLVWIGVEESGLISLKSTPSNIGDVLYENVWNRGIHHVLTSGTMSDCENFGFFEKLNGLNKLSDTKKIKHCSLSPFDYKHHTRLYIPNDIPMPENSSEEYVNAVAKRIVELVHATNGHTAILFTSYKLLRLVYDIVVPQISEYKIFSMTKSNRSAIADFKRSKNGVLFASGSMWEGVDCIGDTLSSVIIVRLPFPIRSAIMEVKKQNCANTPEFVREYAVPEMIIKLRQGIGRLIRCESDTGLISILDARTLNSSYSEKLEKVLSKYPRVQSIDEIKEFFKTVKPDKYFAG